MTPQPAKVCLILGMHRSGTSCLTGSLQQAGLDLGEHSTWNLHNKKGNRENPDIVEFHETVLRDNNGSWDRPPKRILWTDTHRKRAEEILADHASQAIWGFKDPRCLLMLEHWAQVIEYPLRIGIFRHPYLVAKSINKRGSGIISIEEGLNLWFLYNKKLLQEHKQNPFPLIYFDTDQDNFQHQVRLAIDKLGLNQLSNEMNFYAEELVSNKMCENFPKLPLKIRLLHRKLKKISIQ